jgi:BlaI family transcriptional regulator, penicillinase repressor
VSARLPSIGETELDVLKVLWERGDCTVRDIQDALKAQGRDLGYTTVQTHLTRLAAKGIVASDKTGPAHVFRAAVSREQLLQQRLTDLADQLCDGTASPLLLALVEGQKLSADEIDRFRRLLDDLEGAGPPPEPRRRPKK